MGIGDEIMVTGEVKRRAAGTVRRFAIRDPRPNRGLPHRWEDVWAGNPLIARPGETFDEWLDIYPGNRPYIAAKQSTKWTWREYGPEPGELYLTDRDLALKGFAQGRVVVQPAIKARASPNKHWGWHRWQQLVDNDRSVRWLQMGEGHEQRLRGVPFIKTVSFREACGVLTAARAIVVQEGALHHAAAALGTPAVVLFGGFISPRVTGYAAQRSLFVEDAEHPLGCGARMVCPHCRNAMAQIKPSLVMRELEALL